MDKPLWAQNVKMCASLVHSYQNMISAGEGFNYQIQRMTHSADISHPASLATSVIAQWAHEPSGHDGRDGGCTASATGTSTHQIYNRVPNLPAAEINTDVAPFLGITRKKMISLDCFHNGRGSIFYDRIYHLPCTQCSAKTSHRLKKCLTDCYGVNTALLLRKITLQKEKCSIDS